jgi:hypothetical protein
MHPPVLNGSGIYSITGIPLHNRGGLIIWYASCIAIYEIQRSCYNHHMPDIRQQIIVFLNNIALFDGFQGLQLEQIASYAKPITLKEGESLQMEGKGSPFIMVVSGKVRYTHPKRVGQSDNYVLKHGDFVGADQVLQGRPKSFTLVALSPVLLFSFPIDGLRTLLNTIPRLTQNIKRQLAWYNLIHSKPFSWLGEEETVKVVCRKHPAYLFLLELAPLGVAWIGVVVIILASQLGTASLRLVIGWTGAGVVAACVIWAIWRYFDWGNDFYVVTDQRIVWVERTIGLYDSRQEAPLVAIKSGETKSSFSGRMLGFGDVITQTFVGQVLFRHIGNPEEIKNLIDQERKAALERQMATDIHAIEGKIRQKIEPSGAVTVQMRVKDAIPGMTSTPLSAKDMQLLPENLSFWQSLLALFRTRWESGGMITYRKHLFVLFRMTWFPTLCAIGLLVGTGALYYWRVHGQISLLTPGMILLVGIGLAALSVLWWLYRFIDWSNDIYRVTPDKIIDSERKPLGAEISKSAPLDNIIGLDSEKMGFLGVVLNFGNVIINVGTENKFIFYNIHNPTRAQKDIFNYMNAYKMKKLRSESVQEQERVSSYIAAYHRQAEDLRQSKKPPQI